MIRISTLVAFAVISVPVAAGEAVPPGLCHAGAYALSDGSYVVVTPSNEPNLRYRFLNGAAGRLYPTADHRYESGDGWSVREPVTLRVNFGACGEGVVEFRAEGGGERLGHRVSLPTTPLWFESGEVTLYGELVMPADASPRAVVVLQYGSGRDSAVFYNYLQYLLPLKGIAVFVFDKRGTGRSGGEFSAHIGALANDVVAAVAAVRPRIEPTGAPLGLMGESQGGWVVPLAATGAPVDFIVVGYGLAVSMLEEDRMEMAQSLRAHGFGPDVLAKGEELHRAAAVVMVSRFRRGMDDLQRLKSAWRDEAWFEYVGGDLSRVLATTPPERMSEVRAMFDFPYDLAYDPLPAIRTIHVPQLWMLAGMDTEAPHESTLAILEALQAEGAPIEVAVFPLAEHGMIKVEEGSEQRLAGQYADGYFDLLIGWILEQKAAVTKGPTSGVVVD